MNDWIMDRWRLGPGGEGRNNQILAEGKLRSIVAGQKYARKLLQIQAYDDELHYGNVR